MEPEQVAKGEGTLYAKNIGGIEETSITFSPGVTILVGRNATNRTSLLYSLMGALGSENVLIKGDVDEAEVELTIGDETYTRRFYRRSGDIVAEGEPYLDEPTLADLFAFLVESNEARRAVARNDDLRELIMRPVDTDAIQTEIDRLVAERKRLEEKLDELEDLKANLPDLEEERTRLTQEIDEKKARLETKEEEIEREDADVGTTRENKAELEEKLEELQEKRSQLDDVRFDLETKREMLQALQEERRELQTRKDELPETPIGDIEDLESRIGDLRDRKQELENSINELQSVIRFNEDRLSDVDSGVVSELAAASESGSVTDELLSDEEVTCWTCGSEVTPDEIEATLDQLRDLSQEKVTEVRELDDMIEELNAERRDLRESQQERDRIEQRLRELGTKIERTENEIDVLQERRDEFTEEISRIEEDVTDLEDESYSEILELHREANQLEHELGRMENDLDRVEDEIAAIEARLEERDDIEKQKREVQSELQDQRTRIERLERQAVEQFNEHMDTVLEILEYENIDRIWLQRVEREVRDGRQKVTKSKFELDVVRTTDSGVTYEDTVAHLSESEREVTGLILALAGYLAHDVYEQLPFLILDSLEAIDSQRIATLVEYLEDYTGYLVVALLPEDSQALHGEYQEITEI